MQHRSSGTPATGRSHEVTVYLLAPGFESALDAWKGLPALEALLDPSELDRADRFMRLGDRRRFVVAHALLRIAVADHLGVPSRGVRFDATCTRCGAPHGAPRLVEGVPPGVGTVAVSLSRSSGIAAVALLSPTADTSRWAAVPRVGVDVERVGAVDFAGFDGVALSSGEVSAIEKGDLRARAGLWVQKEAIAKALGIGLRRDPDDIETSPSEALDEVVSCVVDLGFPYPDHRLAVAVAPAAAGDTVVCTIFRAESLVRHALDC